MPDANVGVLIDRIVAQARIPSRARREELRRELWTHFECAAESRDALDDAVHRFGEQGSIAESLRYVYRHDYAAWYLAKIAAAMTVSVIAALVIELVVNVRMDAAANAWRLAPGFFRAIGMSTLVTLGVCVVWESAKRPVNRTRSLAIICAYLAGCIAARAFVLSDANALLMATLLAGIGYVCSSLERWSVRLPVLVVALASTLYINHALLSVAFGPGRALLAGVVLGAVCSSALAIVNRVDRVFASRLDASPDPAH